MRQIRYLIVMLFVFLAFGLSAYQRSFFSLISPTELGTLDSELDIQHRFKGRLDGALSNFFGMDDGANVGLIYRQAVVKSFELRAGHISKESEYFLELCWRFTKEEWPVQAQANLEYFAFENLAEIDKNRQNFMFLVAAQNRPEWNRLIGNINLGYDADKERFLTGIGAGVLILNNLTWMIEYFPVWDRNSDKLEGQIGDHNSFSTGLKYDSGDYQFMLVIGNNDGITLRSSTLGSDTNKLKFGVIAQKKFNFF